MGWGLLTWERIGVGGNDAVATTNTDSVRVAQLPAADSDTEIEFAAYKNNTDRHWNIPRWNQVAILRKEGPKQKKFDLATLSHIPHRSLPGSPSYYRPTQSHTTPW